MNNPKPNSEAVDEIIKAIIQAIVQEARLEAGLHHDEVAALLYATADRLEDT